MSPHTPAPAAVSWWFGPTGQLVHFQGQVWPPVDAVAAAPAPEPAHHTWTWRNRGSHGTGELTKVTQRRALQH